MKRIYMTDSLTFSKFSVGFWRLMDWGMTTEELDSFVNQLFELGITTFDHADIYGGYKCEEEFGKIIKRNPSIREKMEIVTKCGIKLVNPNRPENTFHCYDTTEKYIINSAEQSLKNFHTEYIDVLLIHRVDFLMNADSVAKAFNKLREEGKVLHFGVSNFKRPQLELLQSRLDFPLVTDQVELNLLNLTHIDNGDFDYFQKERISPMIWSPLAGGRIFNEDSDQCNRIRYVLGEISAETGYSFDQIALAWLLKLPLNLNIVLGSGKIERIKSALGALEFSLTNEQWYRLWTASKGYEVP
ncbi:MAG: oxidoreductase [Ignavibacteria bacterium]|nr:MAG: oxidoreductase [Ignavibacteria bacterium]